MSNRGRVGGLVFAAALAAMSAHEARAQLRLATWNISHYDGTDRAADIQTCVYAVFSGRSMAPDVIAAQEFDSAGALNTFVNVLNATNALNPAGSGYHDWAAGDFFTGPDSQTVIVFRTSKIAYIRGVIVALSSGSITDQPRNTYRFDIKPTGYNELNSAVGVYSIHLKSGGTSENARQLIETTHIRNNAAGADTNGPGTGLPAGYHFIFAGDTNIYTSAQTSYQELVAVNGQGGTPTNGAGQFFDPIMAAGNWNNNGTFQFIHTQDPSGPGGMDDRHDQILLSAGLRDGAGFDYIGSRTVAWDLSRWDDPNHSYRCWGNDGTSFNLPLTVSGNTNVGPTIAQALKNAATTAGGHLPVYLDLRVPARLRAPPSIDFGTVVQGSPASVSISVGNGGNVALWTANGLASLGYTLAASAGFGAPGGNFTDAPGGSLNSHSITMSTSTPGPKTGTLTITLTGADELTRIINITGNVVPPNQPPIADAGPDQSVADGSNSGSAPVTLDGTQSHDPDGAITDYRWSEGATVLAQGSGASAPTVTLTDGPHTITLLVTDNQGATGTDSVQITVTPGPTCGSADFNHDGDIGTDADIEAFFACLGGSCCPTCDSADFNGDGDIGTDADIEAFFRVLGGGPC
jgi:endonuclease/exonuclease/phosphatase family metal-dependent hydrolase